MIDETKKILDKLNTSLDIQQSSSQLIKFLVQDLLDYAQIKSSGFRKNYREFNIVESIQKVMDIQKMKAESIGIKLSAEYQNIQDASHPDHKYGPMITHDEHRIQQVLLNLQSNALKFTTKGHVKILVSIVDNPESEEVRDLEANPEDVNPLYLKIQVEDTGVGIKPSE